MKKLIAIGDPHGCLQELTALVEKVGYEQGRDDLYILGDFLDRGPDPVGVVAYAMAIGAKGVKGNHEEKALRFLRHEIRAGKEPKYKNPMRPPRPDRLAQWKALSAEQIGWLDALPWWVDFANGWIGVHAGFERKPLDQQKPDRVVRIRYVNANGEMVGYRENELSQPADTLPWMPEWARTSAFFPDTGKPKNVLYGHAVHSRKAPRVDMIETPEGLVQTVGLDTGCVFGGKLTAAIFDAGASMPTFMQVPASHQYVEPLAPVPDEQQT